MFQVDFIIDVVMIAKVLIVKGVLEFHGRSTMISD
jgi:hypothetical protein